MGVDCWSLDYCFLHAAEKAMTQSIAEEIAAHTPTPWFVDGLTFDSMKGGNVGIVNLARASKADVAFIVQACNAYTGFVALQRAVDGFTEAFQYGTHSEWTAALADLRLKP
jgi:hypothetical protein